MRTIFIRGFKFGGSISFDVIWESGYKRGNFLLAKNSSGGFTFGQDPEDFYNNVCEDAKATLDRLNDCISILKMDPLCHMSYYMNKLSVYEEIREILYKEVEEKEGN